MALKLAITFWILLLTFHFSCRVLVDRHTSEKAMIRITLSFFVLLAASIVSTICAVWGM